MAYSQYEYSIDNSTWYSTNVFSNLGVGTYTPYVRNICQAASPLTLTAQTLSATATPGNPATYGTNQWNVYTYNGYNLNTYFGFYTTNRTSEFNIGSDGIGVTSNPSAVTGGTINGATVGAYTGCALGNDNWSISAKRQGFPCATYNINLSGHDDEYVLNIDFDGNGTVDFTSTAGCCNVGLGTKWTGVLSTNSRVEIILKEGGGDAYVDIDFVNVTATLQGGTIAGITNGVTICNATDPGAFTNAADASAGTSAAITGGTSTYQWESSTTNGTTGFTSISGQTSATYDPATLTQTTWFRRRVTDACGTIAYSNVIQVIVIPYPTGGSIATVLTCAGATATVSITGATNATQYSWVLPAGFTGSSTTSSITVTAASPTTQTNYTITAYPQNVSGGTTCTGTLVNGTVTVRPLPQVSNFASATGGTSICNGDIGQLVVTTSNGTGPFTVVYNNGTSNQTASGVVSGTAFNASPNPTSGTTTYTLVSVTDANGCVRTTAFTDPTAQISVRQLPTATISGTTTVCQGATSPNITFTGSNTGGTAPPYIFTYNINGGSNQTVTTTSGSSVTVAVPTGTTGTFTYNLVSVAYTSNPGCSNAATGSATVTVNPNHTLSLTSSAATTSQTVCNGVAITNITYSVGAGATGAGVTGLPSGVSGNFTGGILTISGTPTQDGTFTYTVTSMGNGCTVATATGTITVHAALVLTPGGTNVSCNGGTNGTASVTAYGGTGTYTYSWYSGGSSSSLSGLGIGTYTVLVTSGACSGTTSYTVTQPSAITGSASAGASILCNGGTTTLTATASGGTGALQYSLNGGAYQSSNSFTVGAGTHTITVKDANNCTQALAAVVISQPSALVAKTCTNANDLCQVAQGQIKVEVSGGVAPYNVAWSPTHGTPSSPQSIGTSGGNITISSLQGGVTYTFVVTDANGCVAP